MNSRQQPQKKEGKMRIRAFPVSNKTKKGFLIPYESPRCSILFLFRISQIPTTNRSKLLINLNLLQNFPLHKSKFFRKSSRTNLINYFS